MSGLDDALARTRPESRARRLVEVIHAECERYGRGVEVEEIRQALVHRDGDAPKSLTSEVHSLKRRGVVTTVGGRPGHTLFALPGLSVDGPDPDDEAEVVLRAVRRAWRRERRPLSTRQVRKELERLEDSTGIRLLDGNSDRLRKRLEVLSRRTQRGPAGARAAKVRKVEQANPTGRRVSYWMPAGATWNERLEPAPPDRASWVRSAVAYAQSSSGIPVSRRDLRWWHDQLQSSDVMKRAVPRDAIGRVLSDTARSGTGVAGQTLYPVTSPFTCFGGAPVRYAGLEPGPLECASVGVLDLAQMLRLDDELTSLDALRNRAALLSSDHLFELVDLREQLLSWNLKEALAGASFTEVYERLLRYLQELAQWASVPSLTANEREGRLGDVRNLHRHLEALKRVSGLSVPDRHPAFRVGETGLFNRWEMEPAIEAARKLLFLEPGTGANLLAPVRRFPPSGIDGNGRIGNPGSVDLALLDRVDAVHTLFELFSVPRAWILLNQAQTLLGRAFRDFRVLNWMLEEDLDPFVRQAVVVSVGWLGLPLPLSRAVADPGSFDEVSAWALSIVLADWFTAEDRLSDALSEVRGPAQQVLQRALMRLQLGAVFSVVG